ncbi:MAG: antitoxin family protein [Chloroflexi bacterium]|nr:antitoxin family protein [Chloroflexota bacterium]
MSRTLEAVYERGVFKPLESLDIPEHQRVVLIVQIPNARETVATLESWHKVFEGLSEKDIAEIESIALDRNNFMTPVR